MSADDDLGHRLVADLELGFEKLVHAYERTVFSTALRITGSTTEAEDLTSECFLRAFRALRDYPADRLLALQPKAWLMTILLNTWRNRIREAGRRVNEVSMAELPERANPERSPEEQLLVGESAREMNRLLSALPAAQRSAIVLRHVLGLPMAEVSRVMNCPEGTAKSHVSRGMTALRGLYSGAAKGRSFKPGATGMDRTVFYQKNTTVPCCSHRARHSSRAAVRCEICLVPTKDPAYDHR